MVIFFAALLAAAPIHDAREAQPSALAGQIEADLRDGPGDTSTILLWTDAVARSSDAGAKARVRRALTDWRPFVSSTKLQMASTPVVIQVERHTMEELAREAQENPDGGYASWFCEINVRSPKEQELKDQLCNLPSGDTTAVMLGISDPASTCLEANTPATSRAEQFEQATMDCLASFDTPPSDVSKSDMLSQIAIEPITLTLIAVGGTVVVAVITQRG